MYENYVNKVIHNNFMLASIHGYLKVIVVHGGAYCSNFRDRLGLYCVDTTESSYFSVYMDYIHLKFKLNSRVTLVKDVVELLKLEKGHLPPQIRSE